MIFIITIILLAADFYYLKNIAGRRLVGLRWWNEVDTSSGDSRWVFESADPETRQINATDKRFFWLSLYAQPLLWIALAVVALVKFEFIWLTLIGELDSLLLRFVWGGCRIEVVVVCAKSRIGYGVGIWGRFLGSWLTSNSDCPHPHHHQHACLLPLRQVQPGFQLCRQRILRRRPRQDPRKQHGDAHVPVMRERT